MNPSPSPRTDLSFLRRRIKPGNVAATPAPIPSSATLAPTRPATPTSPDSSTNLTLGRPGGTRTSPASTPVGVPRSAGLSLGQTGQSRVGGAPASSTSPRAKALAAHRQKAKHEDHEVALLFPAPGIADIYELNLVERVLRLSPLESAVGTLLVTGSTATAWESVRFVAGGRTVDGHQVGTPIMTPGNRELVGYQGRDALIALRHVRLLRRAIFMNRSSQAMGVKLISGETVALPPAADGAQIVLLAHRIGNVLELRAEPVPLDWPDLKIWQEFNFTMTHQAPSSAYGR